MQVARARDRYRSRALRAGLHGPTWGRSIPSDRHSTCSHSTAGSSGDRGGFRDADLKHAMNDAMRDWVASVDHTHYLIGSVNGPHPFPILVRDSNG